MAASIKKIRIIPAKKARFAFENPIQIIDLCNNSIKEIAIITPAERP